MSQEFLQPHREQEEEVIEELSPVVAQEFNVDALLDDIDSVLETNATDFVQSFVQKGGQ